jgi:SAM-dependent methyltransferase
VKSTERFTSRVENYARFRPAYPPQVIDLMRREMDFDKSSVVADIGFGTGIFTKMLLEAGASVFGVEPNAAMRGAGEDFLANFSKFSAVNGTAENTNLPNETFTHVTAAQAFHWFDAAKTKSEFHRILRSSGGFIVLIWNLRRRDADDFAIDYENFLREFGTDYESVEARSRQAKQRDSEFFDGKPSEASFENSQIFDFQSLKGRVLSSSYVPTENDVKFSLMIKKLADVFARHEREGFVKIYYDTKVFYKRVK